MSIVKKWTVEYIIYQLCYRINLIKFYLFTFFNESLGKKITQGDLIYRNIFPRWIQWSSNRARDKITDCFTHFSKMVPKFCYFLLVVLLIVCTISVDAGMFFNSSLLNFLAIKYNKTCLLLYVCTIYGWDFKHSAIY